jgi:hypothetical protein
MFLFLIHNSARVVFCCCCCRIAVALFRTHIYPPPPNFHSISLIPYELLGFVHMFSAPLPSTLGPLQHKSMRLRGSRFCESRGKQKQKRQDRHRQRRLSVIVKGQYCFPVFFTQKDISFFLFAVAFPRTPPRLINHSNSLPGECGAGRCGMFRQYLKKMKSLKRDDGKLWIVCNAWLPNFQFLMPLSPEHLHSKVRFTGEVTG